jgi:ubiquinone/menaquinone biosynthesis C-methylase UbiE
MPVDKSFFFYGGIYHKLLDPHQAEAREVIAGLIPEGSSVLDIACGTGQLSFALRAQKQCRVIGIDLSLRMLQFAEKSNRDDNVKFVHQDATDLTGFGDDTFHYAIVLLLMHELPREKQLSVLSEALRVANKTIIVDATAPLPKNLRGLGVRFVEATFGRDHHGYFRNFLATGGIMGLLENSDLPITIAHRSVFWHSCREVVMVSKRE